MPCIGLQAAVSVNILVRWYYTVIQCSSIKTLLQRNWWLIINNKWKIIISGTSEIRFNMFPINWGKKNYPFSSRIYHQTLTLMIDAYLIDSYFSVCHWNNTLSLDSYPTSFHLVGCSGMFYPNTADRDEEFLIKTLRLRSKKRGSQKKWVAKGIMQVHVSTE